MRATRNCIDSKENRPLFAALGQGVALIPVFSLPPQGEGLARRQGAWPGLLQTGPGVRGSWAGPDRRALGVKRHAPRLAARQRGIFAFVPLTVVRTRPTPSGRRGCPSTARGRWLRPPSPAGAAPVPRQQDASGRRPRRVDRDGRNIITLQVKSSIIFTGGVFLYGE